MVIRFFAKPDTPNNEAIQAFFDNFDLIQQHKEEIYVNPEYYNIFIQGCGAFPLYTPPIKLSIGELLKLWDETECRTSDFNRPHASFKKEFKSQRNA